METGRPKRLQQLSKVFTNNLKRFFYLALSVYAFLQCTFFIGKPAHLLLHFTAPLVNGHPLLFSLHDMTHYFNIIFYFGLLISGLFFIALAEPILRRRVKNNRFISIPLAIIATPLYFILLCLGFSGVFAFWR